MSVTKRLLKAFALKRIKALGLEISFALLMVLVAAFIATDDRITGVIAKFRGPLPSPIAVMEREGLVLVRSNTPRALLSEQLESFEFFWKVENADRRLVQIMRDDRAVLYRAER